MDKIKSQRILALQKELENKNYKALDSFWDGIISEGAPIIEAIKGDNENLLVTFLYKAQGKIDNVVIHGTAIGFDYMENRMESLQDTNIWYKTYTLPNNIEFVYWLSINDALDDNMKKRNENFTTDELNPNKFIMKDDPEEPAGNDFIVSYVKMPLANNRKWIIENNEAPKGTLDKHIFKSEILNNQRRIWVYTPNGYKENNDAYPLLVLTDGHTYVNWLSAVTVLDKLIHKQLIPPTVAVFVSSIESRYEELTCNDGFSKFVVDEVLPFVHTKYNVTNTPKNTIIGGHSIGGLTAAYLGLSYPNIFGNVLSQSGSFFWKPKSEVAPEWLINKYESIPKLPLNFYITYGVLENSPKAGPTLIQSNQRFIKLLRDRDYKVISSQFQSGHDYLNWGETLAEGLIALSQLIKEIN